MSGNLDPQRRWHWLNGWLTAALNASVIDGGVSVGPGLTVTDFMTHYSYQVRNKLDMTHLGGVRFSAQDWELEYIFHLEEEMWGPDWAEYAAFYPPPSLGPKTLETFRFVLLFYIAERCLKLFLNCKERYSTGRKGMRRKLFGKDEGLFTVKAPELLWAMGAPFYLVGSTKSVRVVGGDGASWRTLRSATIPTKLQQFYHAMTGKEHFADIVETALRRAREDHLAKSLRKKKGEPLPCGTEATWYDVLWHYSESVRYNPFVPRDVTDSFYWNRTVRWFTSLLITGLLRIASSAGAPVIPVWQERHFSSLWNALGGNNRFS